MLTTHYMVEADELCDRVAIINKGQVLACDKPEILKQRLQKDVIYRMEVSPLNGFNPENFQALTGVKNIVHTPKDGFTIFEMILEEDDALGPVLNLLTSQDIHILNLQKRESTLEDVFVDLVGRSMSEVEESDVLPK